MRLKWSFVFALVIAGAFFLTMTPGCKSKPAHCAVCDREIHAGMKATVQVNGKTQDTCCIACGIHFKTANHEAVLQKVTDYATGREIFADRAVFLYGSDIQTCGEVQAIRTPDSALFACYDRCQPAVVAFSNTREALPVQKIHGGKLVNLTEIQKLFESL